MTCVYVLSGRLASCIQQYGYRGISAAIAGPQGRWGNHVDTEGRRYCVDEKGRGLAYDDLASLKERGKTHQISYHAWPTDMAATSR